MWGGCGAVFPVNERRRGGDLWRRGLDRPGGRKKEGGRTIPDCGGALPGQERPGNDRGGLQPKKEVKKPTYQTQSSLVLHLSSFTTVE